MNAIKLIVTFLLLSLLLITKAQAQENLDTLKENKHLPDFRYYTLTDSSLFSPNLLPKNKPVLIIYFNTECDHCQDEIKKLCARIDDFKSSTIILVSRQRRTQLQAFVKQHELNNYPLLVLMDSENLSHQYFQFSYIPCVRLYNKKRKLIEAWNEEASLNSIKFALDNF